MIIVFVHSYIKFPSQAIVKLEKSNDKPNWSCLKAELLQISSKEDLNIWNNILEPNYVKHFLSTQTLWSVGAELLKFAQLLYTKTLGVKKPLVLTPSSGPIKVVSIHFFSLKCCSCLHS